MRMLRWLNGKTEKYMIRIEDIKEPRLSTNCRKMRKSRLRWFGHVYRRPEYAVV